MVVYGNYVNVLYIWICTDIIKTLYSNHVRKSNCNHFSKQQVYSTKSLRKDQTCHSEYRNHPCCTLRHVRVLLHQISGIIQLTSTYMRKVSKIIVCFETPRSVIHSTIGWESAYGQNHHTYLAGSTSPCQRLPCVSVVIWMDLATNE